MPPAWRRGRPRNRRRDFPVGATSCRSLVAQRCLHLEPLATAHRQTLIGSPEQQQPMTVVIAFSMRPLKAGDGIACHQAVAVNAQEDGGELLLQLGEGI